MSRLGDPRDLTWSEVICPRRFHDYLTLRQLPSIGPMTESKSPQLGGWTVDVAELPGLREEPRGPAGKRDQCPISPIDISADR